MADVFDEIEAPAAATSAAGDVFDTLAPQAGAANDAKAAGAGKTEDVFDQVEKRKPIEVPDVKITTPAKESFGRFLVRRALPALGESAFDQLLNVLPDVDMGELVKPAGTMRRPVPVKELMETPIPGAQTLAKAGTINPLVRMLMEKSDVGQGIAEGAESVTAGALTPKNIMMLPAGAAGGARAVGMGFAGQMLAQEPGLVSDIAEAKGPKETAKAATVAGANLLMAGAAAHGALTEGTAKAEMPQAQAGRANGVPTTKTLSEFGGVADVPTPEKPETIEAQLEWLKEGKRKAVLITPGAEKIPTIPEGTETVDTTAGTIAFDPKQTNREQVQAAVSSDKLGELLGYGIPKKPEVGPSGVVVVRGPEGTEKQAVVTDELNLPSVVKAAGDVADPGDSITLEDGKSVIAERQGQQPTPAPSRIEQKAFREMLDAREDLPAELVQRMGVEPGALPEGYELQKGEAGTPDRFVFSQADTAETPEAAMVRENQEAMARLREQQKKGENEDPDWSVPGEEETAQRAVSTERPEAGTPIVEHERAPDILDWIGDNYPGGVKIGEKADYGEYLNQARGRARELMSATKGEAADRVLKALHDEGLYRRLESPDDLLAAMNAAGEERIAWRERQKGAQDRIDAWLSKAIEATAPEDWTGTTALGIAKLPVWLAQQVAHDTLLVVRAAYRGGRNLMDAIEAGVEHVRGLNLPGFNAGEVQDWLARSLGERETGQKVSASTAVSDPVKDTITQYLYEKRTNATDEELARGIVQRAGLDGAQDALRNPPGNLAQATWSKLLGEVTRGLAERERDARARGDEAAAAGLAQRQAALWDEMLPRITEMAQGLQALNDIVDMSPDAQVARLKNRLEQAADRKVAKVAPAVEVARGALEEGRNAGVEQVRQDPAVNEAARKAVDQAVQDSDEVKKAVIVELVGAGAQSPHIVVQAKQAMQGMMAETMRGRETPKGMTAAQHARAILGDMAQRAADVFAGHIQGAEPGKTLVQKLQERLGLSEARSRELATQLSKEWDRQVKEAQAKIPKRIANARATRERNLGQSLNSPTSAVDAAIRRQLDALNVKLGDVLKAEAGRQEETGAHVAERVVQASGLQGEAADTMRTVLKNRWDAIVTEAQRRALERLQESADVPVKGKVKGAFEKAVELERLGALTSERFYDVVKQQLGLKRLTAEDAAELRRLVKRAQELPEGFLRQQAAADVLKFTERASGNVKPWDIPLAVWYANVLSGITTPAKIVMENTNLLASSTVASLLSRPRDLLEPVQFAKAIGRSYKRGLAKGALQAASTLKSGVVTGVWDTARVPTILEMKPFGERMEPLNFWKWFTRGISTAHETTFKPAWEFKQGLIARDVARSEGLKGKAADQRVADLMADTEGHWDQARAQALNELRQTGTMNALNLARRTREILEQQRETNMPGSTETARDFALRTAYLNEPYGFMGLIAKGIRGVIENARKEYPILGSGVKTQIPFTTVVANILNEKLNWTPVGLGRALISEKTGELYGRDVKPGERPELYAKAILGTIALGAMAELFGDRIHGNGPSDPRRRKQLQAAGWVPHSIELGGRYYSYMNTPAGLGLAVIGNLNDWHRYGKGDEADGVSRLAFATKATANAIVSQGMLDSLKRVFESLGSESTTEGADKLEKLTARTASSFAVPNLVQQVDRMFDPTVYDKTGMEALLKGQIPFVRRTNKPALTVLGDPVQVGPFAYWAGKQTEDPLLRAIAEKQAWVPEPSKNQIIGDKKRGPDYYRAMTPDEYYDWIALSGREIRRRLTENLDRIATAEPGEARKFVERVAEEERAKAKKLFD